MTDMRECSACGDVSYSVHPKIVELEDGTFAVELRCTDSTECLERQEALEVTP
jgi:hypothetical protein